MGYLLCASTKRRGSFGDFCVRVVDPSAFLDAVAQGIANHFPSERSGARASKLHYGRTTDGDRPENPYFRGTAGNEDEEEYRFSFTKQGAHELVPVELHIPEAAKYCSLV